MDAVTILLPNHHEGGLLAETIIQLRRHLPYETPTHWVSIVVAEDPVGRGVGWALREGLKLVRTPWVVFVMADGSEDPAAVAGMVRQCRTGIVAVWGYRWNGPGWVVGYPPVKRVLNRLGNHLIAGLFHTRYTDWTDLAKAYRTDRLRQITWSDDFRCEIEIPIRYWRRRGTDPILFVPMRWRERVAGRSAFRLRRAPAMLLALWRVWREA